MFDQMKVCFLSTHHDDTDARVVHKEAVELSRAGCDVTYFTPFGENRKEEGVKIRIPEFAEGETFDTLPGGIGRIISGILLFRFAVRDDDYDVYHFHDPELLPIGCLVQFFVDGRFVYDAHEDARRAIKHKQWVNPLLIPILSTMLAISDRVATEFMDGIIAASEDIAARYEHHDNVVTVTNYPPKRWAELDYTPEPRERTHAVYCGLMSENRGILQLIEGIKQVPPEYDVVLKLGGRYESDEFQDRVEAAAANSERVELLGWLPTLRDVIELYYDSDIGLMCFQPEAQNLTHGVYRSNKMFQYMSAELPVIVSDIGNWPEVVENHESGVAVPPNPQEISKAIVEYIENPERRKRHGRNGRNAVMEHFTWEQQRDKLLGFYAALTNS